MQRELRFADIDAVLAELKRLEDGDVETTGGWSFAQILEHLAGGVRYAMNRTDPSFVAESSAEPLFKPSLARKFYNKLERTRKIKSGIANPASPTEREERDPAPALADLRGMLTEFRGYQGPHPMHAYLGELASNEWQIWNLVHCAHHLGFARLPDD